MAVTVDQCVDAIVADLFSSGNGRDADRLDLIKNRELSAGGDLRMGSWTQTALREHLRVILTVNVRAGLTL